MIRSTQQTKTKVIKEYSVILTEIERLALFDLLNFIQTDAQITVKDKTYHVKNLQYNITEALKNAQLMI